MTSPFLHELAELPGALARLVEHAEADPTAYGEWVARLHGTRRVIAVGMGTSAFAPETMRPGLARAGIAFAAEEAGEFLHGGHALVAHELLLLCSQSGASAEIVRLLEQGLAVPPVAITNEPRSLLGRAGRPTLLLHAGPETSISAKTYANTLAIGHLMGAAAAGQLASWRQRLRDVAAHLAPAPADALAAGAAALAGVDAIAVVGRTHAAPAVRQMALTLAEGAGLLAVPLVGGSFRHGPREACGPKHGMIAFAGQDSAGELVLRAATEATRLGSPVVVFTDRGAIAPGLVRIPVPGGHDAEDLSLRASRAQGEFLHAVAAQRGRQAGVFRVAAKVTTDE